MDEDQDSTQPVPRISPRKSGLSPRFSSETSPRWEKQRPTRRSMPKLELETNEHSEPSVPISLPPPTIDDDEEGDISAITSLTVNTKGRRGTRRSQHGSKANTFKAYKQRMDSMAKRDSQRQADKARRGLPQDDDEMYDEDFDDY